MLRWAPLVTLVGCTVEPAGVRSATFDVVAPAIEEVERTSISRLVASAACADLAPCEVVGVRPMRGGDEERRALAIVARRRDYTTRAGAEEAHLFDGRADVFVAQEGGCEPFEVWLVSVTGDRARRERRLARICNEHDLAYHNEAERLELRGDTILRTVGGSTGWRWSQTATLRLSDGAVAYEERVAREGDPGSIETRAGAGVTRATVAWTLPSCEPSGGASPSGDPVSGAAIVIPSLDLSAAFHAGGWKTAPVAACAARVGARGGDVVGGATGATASLEAFVAGTTLFVDVHDDDVSSTGATVDRLEVWSSDWDPRFDGGCVTRTPLAGFEILLSGGEPRLLGGGATAPSVARAAGPDGATRLAITYADAPRALALVYRDVDRGAPAVDVTSGTFDPDDTASAGSVRGVDVAACGVGAAARPDEPPDPLAIDPFRLDVFVSSECRG